MKSIKLPCLFTQLVAFFSNYSQKEGSSFFSFTCPEREIVQTIISFFPEEGLMEKWQKEKFSYNALKELISELKQSESNAPIYQLYLPYDYVISKEKSKPYLQKSLCCMVFDHDTQLLEIFYDLSIPWVEYFKSPEEASRWIQGHSYQNAYSITVSQDYESSDNATSYKHKIQQIQDQICQGNVYQVCLSRAIEIQGFIDNPFAFYFDFYSKNKPRMSAYFALPKQEYICSFSPERLVKCYKDNLIAEPIKGTAPRYKNLKADEESKFHLIESEKEKAELAMITDLVRNDIGKVSQIGTVYIEKHREIFPYTSVWQARSIIKSKKCSKVSSVDIIEALFPGGSISGCPKKSAINLLQSLETSPRSFFTGSIGYITETGDLDFNIAIRTVKLNKENINVFAGGAITIDSNPLEEYQETSYKLSPIMKLFGIEDEV